MLAIEAESLPLLAGLLRTEHESADVLFDQVLTELGLADGLQLAGAIVAEAERLLSGPWPPLD